MKKVTIYLIKLYQKTPLHIHSYCRFFPTCSQYMIEALERFGFFRGIILGTKRILKCNPFGTYGYDPVPNNLKKKFF